MAAHRNARFCVPNLTSTQITTAREREKILSHAWLHVCHSSTIPNAGDYLTCSVAEQDIIVMRGEAGEIRAFYNVCQHRGSELLQGSGTGPPSSARTTAGPTTPMEA